MGRLSPLVWLKVSQEFFVHKCVLLQDLYLIEKTEDGCSQGV